MPAAKPRPRAEATGATARAPEPGPTRSSVWSKTGPITGQPPVAEALARDEGPDELATVPRLRRRGAPAGLTGRDAKEVTRFERDFHVGNVTLSPLTTPRTCHPKPTRPGRPDSAGQENIDHDPRPVKPLPTPARRRPRPSWACGPERRHLPAFRPTTENRAPPATRSAVSPPQLPRDLSFALRLSAQASCRRRRTRRTPPDVPDRLKPPRQAPSSATPRRAAGQDAQVAVATCS